MSKQTTLYNHHRKPVGTATWHKRNSTVEIVYSDEIHYADTTLDFDEFDDYIARMDIKTEEMLNQITLEDLL